jgi:hypothetical protein
MDGKIIDGREIRIQEAKERRLVSFFFFSFY